MRLLFFLFPITFSLNAQSFTLSEPPEFLRAPYTHATVALDLDSLSSAPGIHNGDNILSIPTADSYDLHSDDIERRRSLAPLRDYLRTSAITDLRNEAYNGPQFKLASGYRIRQTEDGRWQLLNQKLKPRGEAFDHLPLNQPFGEKYLACDRERCVLFDDYGEPVEWATDYDLLEFTYLGHLIFLKNGKLGLLNKDGLELIPPLAQRIGKSSGNYKATSRSYAINLGNRNTVMYYPDFDLFTPGGFPAELYMDRYQSTGNNVYDSQRKRWLLPPGSKASVYLINPEDGLLRVIERKPQEGKYPRPEGVSPKADVVHLVKVTGEYLTSVWAMHGFLNYYKNAEQYQALQHSPQSSNGYPRGQQYFNLDRNLQPLGISGEISRGQYFGPDSVRIIKGEWNSYLVDRYNDTLFTSNYDARFHPVGNDTLLVTKHIANSRHRPEDPYSASLIYNFRRKEVTDTLPHLQLLGNGDFIGQRLHLDAHLRPINDSSRLMQVLNRGSRGVAYPYRSKVKCKAYNFYSYTGELIVDDFGNDRFFGAQRIDDEHVLLFPRNEACEKVGYHVLQQKNLPDVKVKKRYVQAYPVGRNGLIGYHYPEVCGGTGVTTSDGTVIIDSTLAFVNRYDAETGLLTIRFDINYRFNEYLTYTGDFLLPGYFDRIDVQDDGAYIVKVDNTYGLYDRQGEILPPVFTRLYRITGNIYEARLPGDRARYLVRNGRLIR